MRPSRPAGCEWHPFVLACPCSSGWDCDNALPRSPVPGLSVGDCLGWMILSARQSTFAAYSSSQPALSPPLRVPTTKDKLLPMGYSYVVHLSTASELGWLDLEPYTRKKKAKGRTGG